MMTLTLLDWYRRADPEHIAILTGKNHLDRTLSGVCVAEKPSVITKQHSGALILVSGIAMPREDELIRLVMRAISVSCTGIVILKGSYIQSIPSEVVLLCAKEQVPLITVLPPLTFEEVLLSVFRVLQSAQQGTAGMADVLGQMMGAEVYQAQLEPALIHEGFAAGSTYQVALLDQTDLEVLPEIGVVYPMEKQILCVFRDDEISTAQQCLEGLGIDYTLGDRYTGLAGMYQSFREAKQIYDRKKEGSLALWVHTISEEKLCRMVEVMTENGLLNELIQRYYLPLAASDTANQGDLVKFLRCYLMWNGQTQEIAKLLKIHRNTVRYKVKKIETLLQCELDQPEIRLFLTLVLFAVKEK